MKRKPSESIYRTILFILFYLLSILMVYVFFLMESSETLRQFLQKADARSTADGFGFYVSIGIIQYGLLISGLTIFTTSTFLVIKKLIPAKKSI